MREPLRKDEEYNEYVKDFYRKIEDYDWNKVTDERIGLESWLHRIREKKTKELIEKYGSGKQFLDVGCGTGLILRHLPPGAIGIDLNQRHLARAAKYAPNAKVQVGDAENIPFTDSVFSTVVCTETLEHLVLPQKALSEIHRVLKPGGIFIGSTPRRALLWRLRFLSSTHYHNEPFHNEYEERDLRALFEPKFEVLLFKKDVFRAMFFFVLKKNG